MCIPCPMRKFCCCCSVETGTLIIGIIGWLFSFIHTLYTSIEMLGKEDIVGSDYYASKNNNRRFFLIAIIMGFVSLLINLLLVFGKNRMFYLPWLVLNGLGCIILSIMIIPNFFSLSKYNVDMSVHLVFLGICCIALWWYCFACVWSHYKELSPSHRTVTLCVLYRANNINRPTDSKDGESVA